MPLRPLEQPGNAPPGKSAIYLAEAGGIRYQLAIEDDDLLRADLDATFFESIMVGFGTSIGVRRDGPTERLLIGGCPGAQARFNEQKKYAILRVVRCGKRVFGLSVLANEAATESEPKIGNFLNSLVVAK